MIQPQNLSRNNHSGGDVTKIERPFIFHDSHRGWLIYSSVEEIKKIVSLDLELGVLE